MPRLNLMEGLELGTAEKETPFIRSVLKASVMKDLHRKDSWPPVLPLTQSFLQRSQVTTAELIVK